MDDGVPELFHKLVERLPADASNQLVFAEAHELLGEYERAVSVYSVAPLCPHLAPSLPL